MRMFLTGLMLAAAVALSGCIGSLTPEEKTAIREAAVVELEYRIDQLQAIGLAEVEVPVEVLIVADAACSFISIASPALVTAMNRKVAEKNLTRDPTEQAEPYTVAEFQANLHAICDIVRKILKVKQDDGGAPEVAPEPVVRVVPA